MVMRKVSKMSEGERSALENRLHDRQSGLCYICDDPVDLILHQGHIHIDHIIPLSKDGPDDENNYALTHESCNLSKGDSDLRVARNLAALDKMRNQARLAGERGANLSHILAKYGGGKFRLSVNRNPDHIEIGFPEVGDNLVHSIPLYKDSLSSNQYFFAYVPIEYIHHDDVINPRDIGTSIRGLLDEFLRGRPQLHVGLTHWFPEEDGSGQLKMFDGQHKAAAQIMLGTKKLPVRVFIEPDLKVLTTTNANAGSTLRQVAFDKATMRHLGHTQYQDRIRQFKETYSLSEDDFNFSESRLANHFSGERAKVVGYIIDALRDSITHAPENRLKDFIEMGGRGTSRPLSYNTVESAFFQLLYKKALTSPMDEDPDSNPRELERVQMITLMNIFSDVFFASHWDPDIGGNRLEHRVNQGEDITPQHLRAWRVTRSPVLVNIMRQVRLLIQNHFVLNMQKVDGDRLFQTRFPDILWESIAAFMISMSKLPCWVDIHLSATVFAANRNQAYWESVFSDGTAPDGATVLTKGLDIFEMIQPTSS